MRIAVLGTGGVGVTLATRLTEVGHEVAMGSRTADNESAARWAEEHTGRHGTFADVAAWGELLVNATGGLVSVAAVTAAGAPNLAGKVLVDVSNPLDGSTGFPPRSGSPTGSASPSSCSGRSPQPESSRPSTR